ncbi:hypothetical protein [Brevibacillus daliensis]|uniref:hypothetical protein n=1 Tax=Brevibacillus daliensis TaxID=2892995 RepID=UPI001E387E72|nr:hypothetical protein [Brevibacillus daliensis]
MKKFIATAMAVCVICSSASVFAMHDGHHPTKKHKVHTKSHKMHTKSTKHHIKGMPKTGMGGASN